MGIKYFDNAATTPVTGIVYDAMKPYLTEHYCNPSTLYSEGIVAREAIEDARLIIALNIGAKTNEIYFTSGGTESDNWAIRSAVRAFPEKKHIVTSKIEHHAVIRTLHDLEDNGYEITYVSVNKNGVVDIEEVEKSIRSDTCLVTIMTVNNEIGSIQPIERIGEICAEKNVLFHTDAVQAAGNIKIDVKKWKVDMLSVSGHKFNAPKGVGFLYVKETTPLYSFVFGGNQERKRRAGTENVPYIVGMATAFNNINNKFKSPIAEKYKRITYYNNRLRLALNDIDGVVINSNPECCVKNIVNFTVKGINSETLMLLLNKDDICVASGSACTSGDLEPSHVLIAMGLSQEDAYNSIRISFSHLNTDDEVNYLIVKLKENIEMLRRIRR